MTSQLPDDAAVTLAPTTAEHLGWLADAMHRFAAALAGADLATPVPSCPGWDLAALGGHLGEVHTWVVGAIREGHPNTEVTPPADRSALPGWYREQADGLLVVLGSVDPATEVWSFGPKPRTAEFWFRRQMHETSMHLWDALAARSAGPQALRYGGDPATAATRAADAVDEVVTLFFPRQVRLGRMPALSRSLTLVATDSGRQWRLAGDGTAAGDGMTAGDGTAAGDGMTAGDGTAGAGPAAAAGADAVLHAPAEELALLIWRRLDLDGVLAGQRARLDGDPEAARAVLSAGLTP